MILIFSRPGEPDIHINTGIEHPPAMLFRVANQLAHLLRVFSELTLRVEA